MMNGPTRNSLPPPPPEAMTSVFEGNIINDASLSVTGIKASSWENIGLWSLLCRPHCTRSILSRPQANIPDDGSGT